MNTRNISWEIVVAGIAFMSIGIYLFNQHSSSKEEQHHISWHSEHPAPPSPPHLPSSIIIDLQNLEDLKNLENLKNLKNLERLKKLEIELKNIDGLVEQKVHTEEVQKHLNKSLEELEAELQKIEKADFKVKLQNQKVYINKDYKVEEAKWTEISPGVYVFRQSFAVNDLQSMDLDLGFGNVNIIGSNSETGELTVRATGEVDDPAQFEKKLLIKKNTSPQGSFHISSAENAHIADRINLEATLTIPSSLAVQASTSGGHINANNLSNSQQFQTSGGHISLDTIEGKTVAKTGGGHITCDQISGDIVLGTSGGHIKVNESSGSLTAKTGGGHIEIQKAVGNILAKTGGGNISASIQKVYGPLKFYTSAGNVLLSLPADTKADLDISGSSVTLSDRFSFNGTKSKGHISGSINEGGIPLVVSCGYGNANINAH